jgi:hypothetical protein
MDLAQKGLIAKPVRFEAAAEPTWGKACLLADAIEAQADWSHCHH